MKTLKKLRKVAKKFPPAMNLYHWERLQAHQNFMKGFCKGLKVGTDKGHALYFLGGSVLTAILFVIFYGILN